MTAVRRFFGEGFRVFFLSAGLYALLAVGLWTVSLVMPVPLPSRVPSVEWHAHELIFGFGAAALGGFLLTAVPNWTGARAARHVFIVVAAGLWLAGRLAVGFSDMLSPVLVAVTDLAFLPVLAAKIATQFIRRPKPQNVMFLGLLALIWTANLFVHLDWTGLATGTARVGLYAGLYGLVAMIAVLGGRVTPAFTRNAMRRSGRETGLPRSFPRLDAAAIAAAIALVLATLAGAPDRIVGIVALLAGAGQIARLAFWRGGYTLGQPILWSLHLSFALIGIGLVLAGLAAFGIGDPVGALHVVAIGGVGGMTLAVMSRASLGHSGRPLVAPAPLAIAYGLLPVAALLRWVAATVPDVFRAATLAAGAAWMLAFLLYVTALWPALWGPRLAQSPE
ncbi:NnrS family protein [Defluviimonas sp. SAOS-178_SWC]|uniref:NnrS family protein n=1 Tax=Defluviimonas sp. SAOS-178_SWC TaxID=3121287 RepID=UPI003221FBB7